MLTKLSTFYLQIFFKGVNHVYIDQRYRRHKNVNLAKLTF